MWLDGYKSPQMIEQITQSTQPIECELCRCLIGLMYHSLAGHLVFVPCCFSVQWCDISSLKVAMVVLSTPQKSANTTNQHPHLRPSLLLNISQHPGPRDNQIWWFSPCFSWQDALRVLGCCLKEKEVVLGKVRVCGALHRARPAMCLLVFNMNLCVRLCVTTVLFTLKLFSQFFLQSSLKAMESD